jgi:hypothetical protein
MKKILYILTAILVTAAGVVYYATKGDPAQTDRAVKEQVIKGNLRVTESVLTDTIKMGDYNWLATSGEFNLRFGSIYSPGDLDTLQFNVGNQSSGMYSFMADAGYYFTPLTGGLRLQVGDAYYSFDGDYFYNATDTLATQAYARSEGGGGGGGGTSDIGYNKTPSNLEIPIVAGTDVLTTDFNFKYDTVSGYLYSENALYFKGSKGYLNANVGNGEYNIAYKLGSNHSFTGNAKILSVQNNNSEKFSVKTDTTIVENNFVARSKIFAPTLANDTLGFVVIETTTGEFKAGILDPVFRGLTDPLIDFKAWLKDTLNKEIKWRYVQNKEIKEGYGLPGGMDSFEALQYMVEQLIRDNVRQDSIIELQAAEIAALKEQPPGEKGIIANPFKNINAFIILIGQFLLKINAFIILIGQFLLIAIGLSCYLIGRRK